MIPNATVFAGARKTERFTKRGIHEAEFHALSPAAAALAPSLLAVSKDRTLLTLLNIHLQTNTWDSLHGQVLKAQASDGDGACFPLHHDSDASLDNRRVTALFYLTRGWRGSDGGELVPAQAGCGECGGDGGLDGVGVGAAGDGRHHAAPRAVQCSL